MNNQTPEVHQEGRRWISGKDVMVCTVMLIAYIIAAMAIGEHYQNKRERREEYWRQSNNESENRDIRIQQLELRIELLNVKQRLDDQTRLHGQHLNMIREALEQLKEGREGGTVEYEEVIPGDKPWPIYKDP